jgi:DNA-binding transcriptional LysR family regulator
MDLESLYYFMETAKDLHITETAERLYMSQQTLSNHIQRVEEHYGVRLFNRRPRLQLTQTGAEVLKFAEQVFEKERNLKNVLTDVVDSDSGEVFIGASSPRYNFYLPSILEKFSKRYPNVRINLTDRGSSALERLVQKNELDFAVCVNPDIKKLNLVAEAVHSDPIYFCVSDRLLYKYYGKEEAEALKARSLAGANLADFKEIPFLMTVSTNRLGQEIGNCFAEADFEPKVYLQTGYTTMMVPLCNAALAGGFSSRMNLISWRSQLADDVSIFPIRHDGGMAGVSLCIVRHKQRYLNHHVRYLLKLMEDHFQSIERYPIARIAGECEEQNA